AFAQQVARLLPAEDGARRIAPGRAVIALIAREEVQEHAGLAERPLLVLRPALEHVAEQILGLAAIEEVLLVRRALVSVARRNGDTVNAQLHNGVEKFR